MSEQPEDIRKSAAAWRRIVAYFIDYVVIATYFGIMSVGNFLLRAMGVGSDPSYITLADKVLGQFIVVLLFTLPVVCYFALFEASVWQATLGKNLMQLRVVGVDGRRISRVTSFVRSIIKLTPWEIAHTGIWHVSGQPFLSPPSMLSWVAWSSSTLFAICWFVSLFIGTRRTPYDWVAKTRVVLRLDPGINEPNSA